MQSFEEWKDMKIKEERRVAHQQQQAAAANTEEPQQPIIPNKNNKDHQSIKKNFASIDCGAKILSANPESSKPSHILTESRDDYMLNSCSNKIWFILELCEPIKINEIEIANFELFSNTPKQFSVFASERYPNKNWTKNFIGTFDASAVRTVQLFNIQKNSDQQQQQQQQQQQDNASSSPSTHENPQIYVKYLRFEMLSHYGNEHYCPLSLVRVYGVSMDDDVVQTIDDNSEIGTISQNLTQEQAQETQSTTTSNKPVLESTPESSSTSPQQTISIVSTVTVATSTIDELVNETTVNNNNATFNTNYVLANDEQTTQKISFFNKFIDNIISFFIGNRNQHQLISIEKASYTIDNSVLQTIIKTILCSYSKVNINCCQCLISNGIGNNDNNIISNKQISYCPYYFIILTKCTSKLFADRYDKIIKQFNNQNITSNQSNYTKITLNEINYLISNDLFNTLNDDLSTSISDNNNNNTLFGQNITEIDLNQVIEETKQQQQQQQQTQPPPQQQTTKNIQITNVNAGKDVIFMRLNNRIKVLEVNMSLSSQYLEQLSQHYRKQIDEMQKLFNKTTNALIDANKIGDERDAKQSERIKIIEKRLDSLQNTINLFYYYSNNFNNNNNITTSTKTETTATTSPPASSKTTVTKSLNYYLKKLNFESNYLNYKFEFLLFVLILLILLNSCVLCIIVLIFRQRYLQMKLNLYEKNKIYLKNVVDEKITKYLNELKIETKEKIETFSTQINNKGDFTQQEKQQNHANAAAAVAVIAASTVAAVAFAASNAVYNNEQPITLTSNNILTTSSSTHDLPTKCSSTTQKQQQTVSTTSVT
jgi:hypothetical protein